jgi:hypothetical protein
MRGINRIKDASGRSKQERGFVAALDGKQVVDIPGKIQTRMSLDAGRETGSGQNSIMSNRCGLWRSGHTRCKNTLT